MKKNVVKKWVEEGVRDMFQTLDSVPALNMKIQDLKGKLEDLKLQKTIEERDIEHLVKIKESKLDIEHQKSEMALQARFNDLTVRLQTEHHNKIIAQIEKAQVDMQKVHQEILKRLPDVTMAITKKVK